jgi:hypothetical protein
VDHNREFRERQQTVEQAMLSRPKSELRRQAEGLAHIVRGEFAERSGRRVDHAVNDRPAAGDIHLGRLFCRASTRFGWSRADETAAWQMLLAAL